MPLAVPITPSLPRFGGGLCSDDDDGGDCCASTCSALCCFPCLAGAVFSEEGKGACCFGCMAYTLLPAATLCLWPAMLRQEYHEANGYERPDCLSAWLPWLLCAPCALGKLCKLCAACSSIVLSAVSRGRRAGSPRPSSGSKRHWAVEEHDALTRR